MLHNKEFFIPLYGRKEKHNDLLPLKILHFKFPLWVWGYEFCFMRSFSLVFIVCFTFMIQFFFGRSFHSETISSLVKIALHCINRLPQQNNSGTNTLLHLGPLYWTHLFNLSHFDPTSQARNIATNQLTPSFEKFENENKITEAFIEGTSKFLHNSLCK